MNSSAGSLTGILELIHHAEGLKRELRHSWLSDGRRESVAEHTWRVALMALLLEYEVAPEVNINHAVRMIIIHDLVEIFAGDVPVFESIDASDKCKKQQAEQAALERIVSLLPESPSSMIRSSWLEFEENESKEAKFAHALDKLEAQIQHNEADISTWLSWEIKRALGGLQEVCSPFAATAAMNELVERESRQKFKDAGIDVGEFD
jgi:putative hydrolases of HD superfamily